MTADCEALSFASNYLASVRLDDVPRFRNGYLPYFSTNDGTAASAIVEARILLSTAPANMTVNVPCAWRIRAPYVQCHEKWFRRDVSWHAFSDGGLCYIHWEEWRDSLDVIERECGEGALLPMGAQVTDRSARHGLEFGRVGRMVRRARKNTVRQKSVGSPN